MYGNFMASIGAMSEKGHKLFMQYIDSFDRHETFEDIKASMSEGMKTFLRLAAPQNGEE